MATRRWSQAIRTPSTVLVLAHHPVDVPPISDPTNTLAARPGVRLIVAPADGSGPPDMIDVTATAALAMLGPWLASGRLVGRELHYQTYGVGKRRRDTIRIAPAGQAHVGGR